MNYSEKLLDPRWQKKRLEIMQRDGFACFWCGDTKMTLHVHHEMYLGDDPWDTPDECLLTLCADCHSIEHIGLTELEKLLLDSVRGRNKGEIEYLRLLNRIIRSIKKK